MMNIEYTTKEALDIFLGMSRNLEIITERNLITKFNIDSESLAKKQYGQDGVSTLER